MLKRRPTSGAPESGGNKELSSSNFQLSVKEGVFFPPRSGMKKSPLLALVGPFGNLRIYCIHVPSHGEHDELQKSDLFKCYLHILPSLVPEEMFSPVPCSLYSF